MGRVSSFFGGYILINLLVHSFIGSHPPPKCELLRTDPHSPLHPQCLKQFLVQRRLSEPYWVSKHCGSSISFKPSWPAGPAVIPGIPFASSQAQVPASRTVLLRGPVPHSGGQQWMDCEQSEWAFQLLSLCNKPPQTLVVLCYTHMYYLLVPVRQEFRICSAGLLWPGVSLKLHSHWSRRSMAAGVCWASSCGFTASIWSLNSRPPSRPLDCL